MFRAIIGVIIFAVIGFRSVSAQTRISDPPITYHLMHKLGKRSDGGFIVYLKVANLSAAAVGVFPLKYRVRYCPDSTCAAGAEELSRVPQPGGGTGGSFGSMPFAADETREIKEDFYGGDAPGIGVFIVSRPGIYKIQAAQSLHMSKHGPWSNELIVLHASDGSWSLVDSEPRED